MLRLLAVLMVTAAPAVAAAPSITRLSLAQPDTISVEIREGEVVTPPRYSAPLTEATPVPHRDGRWVHEDGAVVGFRVGPAADQVQPMERVEGEAWNPELAARPEAVALELDGRPLRAVSLGRKSFPDNIARTGGWSFAGTSIHRIYLRLAATPAGQLLTVSVPGAGKASVELDTRKLRTEGLKVVQTGFRPDDPSKTALFTLWMGSLGDSTFVPANFEVLDSASLEVVHRGIARLHHDGTASDTARGMRGAGAPVYVLDFSDLRRPGRYRVHLPGLGCSHDFAIDRNTWRDAFAIAAKGFYFQRNGIAHTREFGPYEAPRAFHQDDGVAVHHSDTSLMDSGNGLNALGTDKDNFGNLVRGATDRAVSPTWGGYKDAGDWDSRIQHLSASRELLEIAEFFPDAVAATHLNLPESDRRIPDIVHEAKWNIDHYRRLQTPEGGVRGGVEQEEHPNYGETSWLNSLRNYTYAPDPWSSWLYAASAAQLAHVLRPIDAGLAGEYLESARRAYQWGVEELARLSRASYPPAVPNSRNLAAAWLLRITGDPVYAEDFRSTSLLPSNDELKPWDLYQQAEAIALAARTDLVPELTAHARAAILRLADGVVDQTRRTSLRFGFVDENPWWGYSQQVNPAGHSVLIAAHRLTGRDEYLVALLHSAGFGLGQNPTGTVFTSGVGSEPTLRPFMIDPRFSQQSFPPGITVYGPLSFKLESAAGQNTWFRVAEPFVYPNLADWPDGETWFDSFWTIMMNEFTIMQSLGPTALTWGYLAFRP